MKKVVFIFVVVLFAYSCDSNKHQHKAENLVKEWIKTNLDDPKSYTPISFSQLDSIFIEDTDDHVKVLTTRENLTQNGNKVGSFEYLQIIHQYRTKNKFGAVQKYTHTFYFDKDLTKIKDEDIDE